MKNLPQSLANRPTPYTHTEDTRQSSIKEVTWEMNDKRARRQLAVQKLAALLKKDTPCAEFLTSSSEDETVIASQLFRKSLLRVCRDPTLGKKLAESLGETYWECICNARSDIESTPHSRSANCFVQGSKSVRFHFPGCTTRIPTFLVFVS